MVPLRVRSWSFLALLLSTLLVLSVFSAPAEATIKRTLTLRVSAAVTGAGTSVTFAGTLSNTPTGSSLKLQIKAGTTWLDARSLKTTTAAGAYKTAVVMPTYLGKYYFRTIATAGGGRSSATSNTVSVTVLHKVSAAIRPTKTSVDAGETTTFNGHVSPCLVGATVTLQRYTGSSWTKVTTATLSSKCTFARVVRPTATTSYRLSVPQHGNYAPAYSAVVRITYNGPAPTPPTITTTALADGSVGTPYSQTLTKTGQAGTWTKISGALPNAVLLNGSTGEISGTPSTGGTFTFTVRFTETASGLTASKQLSITVVSGPAITTTSLPDATRGTAYSKTLAVSGAAGTWAATGLPAGISLNPGTGVISGTATVAGDFSIGLTYTETSSAKVASKTLPLHVVDSTPPVITTTTLSPGVRNTAYSKQLDVTGNAGTWTVSAGTLPTGVTLSSAGVLSGTPTANTSDDYEFTVTFTETAAQTSDTQDLVLHVSQAANSPDITTTNADLPAGTKDAPYSYTLQGDGSGSWTITRGALPPGLTLSTNPLTPGKISGTPTTPGDYTFQVKYTVALVGYNTKLLTIHVGP